MQQGRQRQLSLQRSEIERTRQQLAVSEAERQLWAEQSELSKAHGALLAEIQERYKPLRQRQSDLARSRAEITSQRGKNALPPVTNAERKLRAQLAELDRARALLEGRPQRDREVAAAIDAMYESSHDPSSYG